MPSTDKNVRIYAELADHEEKHGSPQARDRILILAADAALTAGLNDEAERFRARLLEHNTHHLVRPYASLADALKSSDVYSYVADLRNSFPPAEAERLLASLQAGDKEPERSDDMEAAQPSVPHAEGAPAHLPDPPPLDTFRYLKEEQTEGAKAAASGAPTVAPSGHRTMTVHRETGAAVEAGEAAETEEESEEAPAGIGTWISDALFVVLFVAGLLLAGYTLARPFLSLPDSPFK
jgi:cobalamin biosynthesis Mg chelatase CobN